MSVSSQNCVDAICADLPVNYAKRFRIRKSSALIRMVWISPFLSRSTFGFRLPRLPACEDFRSSLARRRVIFPYPCHPWVLRMGESLIGASVRRPSDQLAILIISVYSCSFVVKKSFKKSIDTLSGVQLKDAPSPALAGSVAGELTTGKK